MMSKKRNAYLGDDSVTYFQNVSNPDYEPGWVVLAVHRDQKELTHDKTGFVRKVADLQPDVDKLWKRMREQEQKRYAQMNETDFNRRKASIDKTMEELTKESKKHISMKHAQFIKDALKILKRKRAALQTNSIYGVAAMESFEKGHEN